MLYQKDRDDAFFITKNFENCYIGDANHPEHGKRIFLLYNYQMTVEYVKFERKIELMSEFVTDYDYGDERQVMYVCNIPEKYKKDFEYFLQGKYSQFSDELKANIVSFWKLKDPEKGIYKVLYANITEKDSDSIIANDNYAPGESWAKPNLSKEIYMNPD